MVEAIIALLRHRHPITRSVSFTFWQLIPLGKYSSHPDQQLKLGMKATKKMSATYFCKFTRTHKWRCMSCKDFLTSNDMRMINIQWIKIKQDRAMSSSKDWRRIVRNGHSLTKIRTGYFLNTCQIHCLCTKVLGVWTILRYCNSKR